MTYFIIDSTCDLDESLMEKHHISMLSLGIAIDDQLYEDKVNISPQDVYEAMKKDILPKTSQPSPKKMLDLFESYCKQGKDFIYLSFSSALSGTYQTACGIINILKESYPHIKMSCIDSKGGAAGIGIIVEEVIKDASTHAYEDIQKKMIALVDRIEHIFTINDLKWLVKGGRISSLEGAIGQILNIKPILHVNKGRMEVIAKERGQKKAISKIMALLDERLTPGQPQRIAIAHSDNEMMALKIHDLIQEKYPEHKLSVQPIGSTLASHLGIGGLGLFFFNAPQ